MAYCKRRYFENFAEFEDSNIVGRFDTIAIIDDGKTFSADLMTDCEKAGTVIRRFFDGMGIHPAVDGWRECITESVENGCYKGDDTMMADGTRNPFPSYAWGVEELGEGTWYIFLNVRYNF